MPPKAACYIRVSTENQTENYSVEEQQTRLTAYCDAKGWEIADYYIDAGRSGGNLERPELQRLLADLRTGKFQIIAVYKLDRLSRSQKDTLTLIEDSFLAHGAEFVSLSESFDTATPFGRAMIGMLSVFAQLEKDQITERFTMGRIGRARAGYYHGGAAAPVGYLYHDGKLLPDPVRAPQVREVFRRCLSGESLQTIQREMSCLYGGWGSTALVGRVLHNSVYIGRVKFAGQEFDGLHPPLISKEMFAQVQALLKVEKGSAKLPFRAGYLLSGRVFCSHCGARYSAVHGWYKCYSRSKVSRKYIADPNCKNRSYPIELLDSIITKQTAALNWSGFPPFEEWFHAAPLEQRRLLLGCLIDSVRIDGERVEIHWRLSPASAPLLPQSANFQPPSAWALAVTPRESQAVESSTVRAKG